MEADERIVLLTADLGYNVFEPLAAAHGPRFINVGVAEQNMVGIATGMAQAGFIPFVYSIATFASLRPFEFIRNGPVVHDLPVRIVGVGGGFEYGSAGVSHYALEDAGIMRTQPGLTVLAPADSAQTEAAVSSTWDRPGPIYYRIGKNDSSTVPGLNGRFRADRGEVIGDGTDLAILCWGAITSEAVAAAQILAAEGLGATVLVVSTLAPAPVEDLVAFLTRFRLAVTVETHYLSGGLGTLVAEVIAEHGLSCRLVRCAVGTVPSDISGSQCYMEHSYGLDAEAIAGRARNACS